MLPGWWQFVNSVFISELLEQKLPEHLCPPPMWTPHGQKRDKINSSQPRSTSSDGSSPSPRTASAIRMVGLAFMKAAMQPFFPSPWICPVVSQPVRACQSIKAPDFFRPSLSYMLQEDFPSSFACAHDYHRTVAKKWYSS